jgi:hypothetical protein
VAYEKGENYLKIKLIFLNSLSLWIGLPHFTTISFQHTMYLVSTLYITTCSVPRGKLPRKMPLLASRESEISDSFTYFVTQVHAKNICFTRVHTESGGGGGWERQNLTIFFYKVLIIPPNTTYRSSTIVFCYTPQHVSAVQSSYHQVGVGNTNKSNELRRYYYINGITMLKLTNTHNKKIFFYIMHPFVLYIYIYIYIQNG